MEHTVDQEFACEDCGFTSPIPNEICPNCSGRMMTLDAPAKHRSAVSESDEDESLSEQTEGGGAEDGQELSLERLQEEESQDDTHDDYGDGDE
ncbi:MAG: hypothetical protein HZB70_00320 [Candidatus Berkelbacteria bacterium]|nr:MAG: hypothetical protein HZB70_00320 [Candidatus Berkelbacteria bacterium]QQG51448.1 MAG: hypothetical protein HY845_02680 [Candidatus Berkelbacteria bacterium]